MSRIETIRTEFVEYIPRSLQEGVLYVSRKYHTASHLCACGCGNKAVTPLNPSGWQLTTKHGKTTLHPSIGNWGFPCESHYWIRDEKIEWARKWSRAEIDAGRRNDRLAQQQQFDASPSTSLPLTLWQRFVRWLMGR
ncbi:DUF6527 family protein [Bradyrhizobium sp. RT3a]|uniref:DUF6527 family protein n=1 Tax=unclassified Bradyrhizobium TaxID=2631580 RepID=UPI00339689B6